MKTGKGKYQKNNESGQPIQLYIGQFLENMFHGDGIMEWTVANNEQESNMIEQSSDETREKEKPSKMKYIGQWKYGKMNGKGKFFYFDGSTY